MGILNGMDMSINITEGFIFNDFDTRKNGMYLIYRSAPTPSEKQKIESVPFAHGVYDFSNILGERIFDYRTISYTFHIHEYEYPRRKHIQTVLENKLMNAHVQRLEDTHDDNYYYLGKCVSVNVEDDHLFGRLIITVEFDCYPFKVSQTAEGSDIWDTFNFELDVMQDVDYQIDGTETITLINPGTPSVSPEVTASSEMTVQFNNQIYTFPAGTSKNESLRLHSGENTLVITGNGKINFTFYKELM